MSPSAQRKKLKDFLLEKTHLYDDIYSDVAKEKFQKISGHLTVIPSLDEYILGHDQEISEQADKVLDELCAKIIPEKEYKYVLKEVGIFSIFLLPPIYPLVRRIIHILEWPPISYGELSVCIVSVLLLLTIIFASAYTVFKSSFTKNN